MAARKRKSSGWDPGRLQLERERFHLPPDYQPPAPFHTDALGDLLPKALKTMGLSNDWKIQELETRWKDLVGAANATHCRPGTWEKGVLTVYVDHNVWLAELQRFGKVAILKRLQRDYGPKSVKDILFHLDPGENPTP